MNGILDSYYNYYFLWIANEKPSNCSCLPNLVGEKLNKHELGLLLLN
jgi:hypothetical protein